MDVSASRCVHVSTCPWGAAGVAAGASALVAVDLHRRRLRRRALHSPLRARCPRGLALRARLFCHLSNLTVGGSDLDDVVVAEDHAMSRLVHICDLSSPQAGQPVGVDHLEESSGPGELCNDWSRAFVCRVTKPLNARKAKLPSSPCVFLDDLNRQSIAAEDQRLQLDRPLRSSTDRHGPIYGLHRSIQERRIRRSPGYPYHVRWLKSVQMRVHQ